MMLPKIFGENLFDNDWMDFPFERGFFGKRSPVYGEYAKNVMKTDIKESDTGYEIDVDLPGFNKEDISAKLDNGYLTISAEKDVNKDEKDENGKYIRKERYTGSMSRSFYVGTAIKQDDIKAKYENGILKLAVAKKPAEVIEDKGVISIEG